MCLPCSVLDGSCEEHWHLLLRQDAWAGRAFKSINDGRGTANAVDMTAGLPKTCCATGDAAAVLSYLGWQIGRAHV